MIGTPRVYEDERDTVYQLFAYNMYIRASRSVNAQARILFFRHCRTYFIAERVPLAGSLADIVYGLPM
jgi:hypothetical protein